jgi:site-specific DNA-adenine methylase
MNKNNHFVISYAGNKRKEVEKIYENIKDKLDDIDNIIEPFCGTSALSCYISQQHPKKFK